MIFTFINIIARRIERFQLYFEIRIILENFKLKLILGIQKGNYMCTILRYWYSSIAEDRSCRDLSSTHPNLDTSNFHEYFYKLDLSGRSLKKFTGLIRALRYLYSFLQYTHLYLHIQSHHQLNHCYIRISENPLSKCVVILILVYLKKLE